jgi:hypothetical protein
VRLAKLFGMAPRAGTEPFQIAMLQCDNLSATFKIIRF